MKRSLTIRSFVDKNIKEKEMLPDGLRNIVISAAQAAKNRNKEDLAVAVKSFSVALSQVKFYLSFYVKICSEVTSVKYRYY